MSKVSELYLQRIKQAIDEQHYSYKEIAEKIGKDYSNFMKILRADPKDKRYFSVEDIINIALLTETNPDYLLGFTDKPVTLIDYEFESSSFFKLALKNSKSVTFFDSCGYGRCVRCQKLGKHVKYKMSALYDIGFNGLYCANCAKILLDELKADPEISDDLEFELASRPDMIPDSRGEAEQDV
jgi:transcriptional regulator with XRE-family HTH domain